MQIMQVSSRYQQKEKVGRLYYFHGYLRKENKVKACVVEDVQTGLVSVIAESCLNFYSDNSY